MPPAAPTSVLLLAASALLAGCGVGGPARGPALRPPSDPMIEHRAGLVAEPVFGGRMYFFEAGPLLPPADGSRVPTLVLVHGLSTQGAGDWRHLVPALARRHRVVSFDLPGFARSDRGDHLYSLERYSRILHWLVETRAGGPVILIGHSLGATLSLYHAGEHPDDVERLILIDAAGILHRAAYVKYVAEIRDAGLLSASADLEEGLNDFIGRLVEFSQKLPPVEMRTVLDDDRMRRRYLRGNPAAVAGSSMLEVDFSQRLGRVRAPTLVIWGTEDDVAPLRTGRVVAARLPDVRLELIQGAGHAPMLDRPADLLRLLLGALDAWPAEDPIRLPAPADSTREGECKDTDDMSFEGAYASLRIDGCDRVQVRNAALGSVEILRSSADFHDVRIEGTDVGLSVDDSAVVLTNVRVEGDTALLVEDARVDLANVELVGRQDAVRTLDDSTLVFSVSRIDSPHGSGTLHGSYEFTPKSRL